MKQCLYCKKNIPDSAKVCPYCGNRLEKGYQPMKRTNSFPNYIYTILTFSYIEIIDFISFDIKLRNSSSLSFPLEIS